MNDLVGFVILHYQDCEVTDLCVQSILRMNRSEENHIIIVDNDVQKKTEERKKLEELYKDRANIHVVQITEDRGFSYANNIGYQYAKELGVKYIIVCNNDIEFQQADFVQRIKKSYEEHHYGVLGPDVVHRMTGEHQNPIDKRIRTEEEARYTIRMNELALKYYNLCYPILMIWDKQNEKNRRKNKLQEKEFYETMQRGIVLFGACFVFSPSYVKEQDRAFQPETRFYYEEYILAYQCKKNGYEMIYDPDIKVWHETGAATKQTYQGKKKRMKFVMEQTLNSSKIYLDMIQKS